MENKIKPKIDFNKALRIGFIIFILVVVVSIIVFVIYTDRLGKIVNGPNGEIYQLNEFNGGWNRLN